MNDCIDLILGKAFFIFIFFHFPDSRLSVLKGFHFHLCFLTWVKTEESINHFLEKYYDNCGRLCSRALSRCVTLKNCLTVAKRHTNRMSYKRVFSLILNENFAVPYSSQNEKNYYSKGHYWPPDYSIILKDKISVIIYLQSLKKNYFTQKFLYFILLQENHWSLTIF